ncbi:MAG: hypothetical protein NPINA01_07790 [Nitrospinaceae bacterium]|nr:MAG: hypothetical protein NPINA01_07790 [Nitrospinaceae bacterium]
MNIKFGFILLFLLLSASPASSGIFDDLMEKVSPALQGEGMDNALSLEKTISGLKEALSVGTGSAVSLLSKNDGYFGNEVTKILMPEKIQNVADMLKKVGFEQQVDTFVLTMNRAAETAAPKAKEYFMDAIKEMTFDDAKKILNGGDTAATEYLNSKTHQKIYEAFKPTVSSSLDQVGGTKAYKDMMGSFSSLPFASAQSLDLDHYVTDQALKGLFLMVGEEEKKIRNNPSARVTDLLQQVFKK